MTSATSKDLVAPPDEQRRASRWGAATVLQWLKKYYVLLPALVFILLFLVGPILMNFWKTFNGDDGFTTSYFMQIFAPQYRGAFIYSLKLSLTTAAVAGILGTILAWILLSLERPRWLRRLIDSFTIIAARSGGVPLAFAYIAAIGTQGVVTVALRDTVGIELPKHISLSNFNGLLMVYLYFQIPLMAVLMLPALNGLKKEWREAASSLGAGNIRYIRDVAAPILAPSIIGALIVVFADSFQAYATAYALAKNSTNLVPIVIGFLFSGNVYVDESMAAALVTGMILIIAFAMALRSLILKRFSKWQQ